MLEILAGPGHRNKSHNAEHLRSHLSQASRKSRRLQPLGENSKPNLGSDQV